MLMKMSCYAVFLSQTRHISGLLSNMGSSVGSIVQNAVVVLTVTD